MTTNAAPASAPQGQNEIPAATVLLAGPQGARREELAKLLSDDGHRVLFPPSADEAVSRITNGDLLLLHVEQVGDPELTLLQNLHASDTLWRIPVVLAVEQLTPEVELACLEQGVAEVLTWPLDAARLKGRVRISAWLKTRWADDQLNFQLTATAKEEAEQLVNSLVSLGVSMVKERDPLRLMEFVLTEGMRITDCEGGTIYMRGADETLHFLLVRNDMLDINMGGSTGKPITFPPLKLYNEDKKPNHQYVANHVALSGEMINIEDAYSAGRFDFSGTRKFDSNTGYRSKSFLTIPLKNDRQQVIGVMQLINARHPKTGAIVRFDSAVEPTIKAFAVFVAAVLDAYRTEKLGSAKV